MLLFLQIFTYYWNTVDLIKLQKKRMQIFKKNFVILSDFKKQLFYSILLAPQLLENYIFKRILQYKNIT